MVSPAEGGMGRQIRGFFKDSSIYGLGLAFNRFISFLVLPIITARLSPADLGVLTLLQVFASVLGIFLNAGVQQAINRNYYDENTDEHRAAVVGTGLLWRFVLTAFIIGPLALAAVPMTQVVMGNASHLSVVYYLLSLANVIIVAPQGIAYTLYRVRRQASRNTFFNMTGSVLSLICMLWLILWWPRGIRGALEAAILANIGITLVMMPDLLRSAKLRLRKDVLRGILSYGLPLLPHHLAIYLLFGADRYFIEHYRTMTEVGLYSYAYRIGMIMNLVLDSASLAWTPFIYSIQQRSDARTLHAVTARYSLAAIAGLAVPVAIFGDEFIRLLAFRSPAYWGAAVLVGWIVGGYVCLGVYQVFSTAVGIPKRTRLLPIFSITGLVVNLVLNWVLVPPYGMTGAAIATLISYACMATLTIAVAQRVHRIPYEWRRLAVLPVAGLAAVGIGYLVPAWPFWPRMAAKALCVALFPALTLLMGFLSEPEKRRIVGLAQRIAPAWRGGEPT